MDAVKLASPELQQVVNDLQALRGVADISAVTIATELGRVSRFGSARQLMGYCGVVPSEASSGQRTNRGGITKTATHTCDESSSKRRGVIDVHPASGMGCASRQESISEAAKEIAWKAQDRLHKRYRKLGAAGKDNRKIAPAIARELLGFIWAIGTRAEAIARQQAAA